ncbi:MAG: hypothetical protein RLZZ241_1870 [Bacteroidota bacterium]
MEALNFPRYDFRFKSRENNILVLDVIRRRYVVLQPEEWVRQHCIQFLLKDKGYPSIRIGVEQQIKINGLSKRVDLAVYNQNGAVEILVECKAPNVPIDQAVFDQIARYNLQVRAKYLMLTNGMQHLFCMLDYENQKYIFLNDLPSCS